MTASAIVAALLALGVLVAWARLGWWWTRAPAGRGSRGWRIALLAAAQPVAAGLLYLTLFPPAASPRQAGVLVVATEGASRWRAGADAVALPEASGFPGSARVPDLATALRAHPGVARLRVEGDGLEARDVEAARGWAERGGAIEWTPMAEGPAARPGIVALVPPGRVAPGAAFRIGGQAAGVPGGAAELIDPGGQRIARAPLDARGAFVLTGASRVPGVALFGLRVLASGGRVVETAAVPVWTAAEPAVRALFLAGAPGPETKYWRRWAQDAGMAARVRLPVGLGMDLGDPAPPLTGTTLSRFDLVVLDERSWARLGAGERAALGAAVRGGLGVVLRVTGPVPGAVRAGWAALGMPVAGSGRGVAARLPGAAALTRWDLRSASAVPLLRGSDGAVLTAWRAAGRGRVGLWTVADAFGLVTSGEPARFGEMWGAMVAAVARGLPEQAGSVEAWPMVGRRTAVCGAGAAATVVAPDGRETRLLPDPVAGGCAGFWPVRAGWHLVRDGGGAVPFHVAARDALPGVRAEARRVATFGLVGAARGEARRGETPAGPGSPVPWLLGFIVVAGLLWRLERVRLGK